MIEIIFATFFGILVGTLTGLIPGLHVNMVPPLLLSLGFVYNPFSFSVFIFSLAITHTFIDYIPSILLGVPSEDTVMGVLPGHKLLLAGRGNEAIKLTLFGSFGCLILSLCTIPFFMYSIPPIYNMIKPFLGHLLLLVSLGLIFFEKKKAHALVVYLLAGILGYICLRIAPMQDPLLPLFTGLFGTSMLVNSLGRNVRLPPQIKSKINLSPYVYLKSLFLGAFGGGIVGFLPGFGSSQAGFLVRLFAKKKTNILITLGGINTANAFFALVAFLVMEKKRSGAMVAIVNILGDITHETFLLLLTAGLIAGSFAFLIGLFLTNFFTDRLSNINYTGLTLLTLFFIVCLVLRLTGLLGLLVLITATSIGLFTILSKIRRMHMMAVLIFPISLWFLGF